MPKSNPAKRKQELENHMKKRSKTSDILFRELIAMLKQTSDNFILAVTIPFRPEMQSYQAILCDRLRRYLYEHQSSYYSKISGLYVHDGKLTIELKSG